MELKGRKMSKMIPGSSHKLGTKQSHFLRGEGRGERQVNPEDDHI